MRSLLTLVLVYCSIGICRAQLRTIADKALRLHTSLPSNHKHKSEVDSLLRSIAFYEAYEAQESKLNGRVQFGFTGNASEYTNIYRISAGMKIDHGMYPYQLDMSSSFQTLIANGESQENLSDIDISFDYHPKVGNGLWLEHYVLLKRFNNTYLGIDQRYEAGTGLVLNWYSTSSLTPTGQNNADQLASLPAYKMQGNNLWACYDDACRISGANTYLSPIDVNHIENVRWRYSRSNIKSHAKLRLALLIGVYNETEQARVVHPQGSRAFPTTNKLRWEVRPTLVYRPNDIYTLRLNPYFKFPLQKWYDDVVYADGKIDRRVDKFYDLQARLTASISSRVQCSIVYRYLKDFAPKRYYQDQGPNAQLIVGQDAHSFYQLNFGFSL